MTQSHGGSFFAITSSAHRAALRYPRWALPTSAAECGWTVRLPRTANCTVAANFQGSAPPSMSWRRPIPSGTGSPSAWATDRTPPSPSLPGTTASAPARRCASSAVLENKRGKTRASPAKRGRRGRSPSRLGIEACRPFVAATVPAAVASDFQPPGRAASAQRRPTSVGWGLVAARSDSPSGCPALRQARHPPLPASGKAARDRRTPRRFGLPRKTG